MEIFCQLCDHVTSKIKSLRSHYKSEHPGEHCFVDNIQCDQCDRKFANSASYLCHKRQKHSSSAASSMPLQGTLDTMPLGGAQAKKINICAECDLEFGSIQKWRNHMRIHHGEGGEAADEHVCNR